MRARWRPSSRNDGNRVYYHEYLEGGHSVGADREEDAMRAALLWAFLTKEVGTTRR